MKIKSVFEFKNDEELLAEIKESKLKEADRLNELRA